MSFENAGYVHAAKCAYVLVAGGLGERLGYSHIKVRLPSESARGACFLQLYCEHIRAFAECPLPGAPTSRERPAVPPLAIMTSDDTHGQTLELLEANDYFGLRMDSVTLMKQEKVGLRMPRNVFAAVADSHIAFCHLLNAPHVPGCVLVR